ncbi:hypothetical protein SSX86_020012 [Deinandra increscens subsp. villosa]|uniref:NB-ARC domain-containing protein n=1 Tax=Deinandra increscens subsp. villosa TaxID=3103831 RepID=A0AAP0CZ00_9ASTR
MNHFDILSKEEIPGYEMEFASPIITAVVDSLMVPLKKHMGFFFSSTKHVAKLNKKLSELNEAKHDMEEKKNDAIVKDIHVPHSLPYWLEEVETITKEKESIPIGWNGCLNLKNRYKAGKGSFNLIKEIDDLLEKQKNIQWSEEQIPLGRVSSICELVHDNKDDGTQNMFKSRKLIFKDVLKSLEADSKTQKIAICGMGGVGKTTMMEDLEKVVRKRGMFKWVLKVVVGQKTDPVVIQQAISQYMPGALTETTRDARAARLQKTFEGMSENGTKKILVILDDVWEDIDLKDIGLNSPLRNGFKLLVTSRDEKVCIKMDIEPSSIFKVIGLEKEEAKVLFWETVRIPNGAKEELHNIGERLLNKCGGLPLAIKTIASTLRGEQKEAWEVALVRLQRHDPEDLYAIVGDIFAISYGNLRKVDKSIFILCGLFPDDFNIAKEELMRYGWGLKLFHKIYHLIEARQQTNTSVCNLIHANLLIESDTIGYVRVHDLARAFVLSNFSEFKQASIVSHGDELEWLTEDTRESCERILVNCAGVSEFPQDFNYPNLALLKLLDGDEQLKFPEDFHKRMEKLEIMAYDNMKHPLHVVSLCYSMSLRTLCLHSCSLVDHDISFVGNLVNLEVLSIAHCGIRKLPSTIGKLKKLKLLDLTRCLDLCIGDVVFQNLDKLEELYLRVSQEKGIRFTDANREELKMLLPKLYAIEVEFFENILQWKDVSFEKLQRFRISFGCFLKVDTDDNYLSRNTLRLVTKCNDLHECKITKLFSKTDELSFSVKDMSCVEDITMSPSQESTFCNLKVLHVFDCPDLTHMFTIPMANSLNQLESLKVSSCHVLKSLVSWCDGVNILELPQLVELELCDLPNFTSIILKNDASQPLLSKEVLVPKLSKLRVDGLTKLKQIWACDNTSGEEDNIVSMLREIEVNNCKSVVNLFPTNPMRLLRHLEELKVENCCSIQVLFNIDVNKELISMNTSSLRRIDGGTN